MIFSINIFFTVKLKMSSFGRIAIACFAVISSLAIQPVLFATTSTYVPWRAITFSPQANTNSDHNQFISDFSLLCDELVKKNINMVIFDMSFRSFKFTSHPELTRTWPAERNFTVSECGQLGDICRAKGITVAVCYNTLSHQDSTCDLLYAHPEFAEIPMNWESVTYNAGIDVRYNGTTYRAVSGITASDVPGSSPKWSAVTASSVRCPLNTSAKLMMYDMIDELMSAFGAQWFHAGMDEVRAWHGQTCPNGCGSWDSGALYAKAVNDIYAHVVTAKGWHMMMWGDMLCEDWNGGHSGYNIGGQDTHGAVDMIPADIVICSWESGLFPLHAQYFMDKGFAVMVSDGGVSRTYIAVQSLLNATPRSSAFGYLNVTWCSDVVPCLTTALQGGATGKPAVDDIASCIKLADHLLFPPLHAYWKFDSNYADSSSYGNNGTVHGNPVFNPTGQLDTTTLKFDGDGDYVDCGNDDSLKPKQNDFTIECWVKPTLLPSSFQEILFKGNSNVNTADGWVLRYYGASGRLYFHMGDGVHDLGGLYIDYVLQLNQWTHVAVVVKRTQGYYGYINGQLISSYAQNTSAYEVNGPNLFIGKNMNYTTHNFVGELNDVRIHAIALESSKLGANDYKYTGYWKFDSDYADSSPYGNNGTVHGNPIFISPGMFGTSLKFDGDGDYVDCGNDDSLKPKQNDFTIECWVKPTLLPSSFEEVLFKGNSNVNIADGWVLRYYGASGRLYFHMGDGVHDLGGFYIDYVLPLNQWTHVAVVVKRTQGYYGYINGQLISSYAQNTSAYEVNGPNLFIGKNMNYTTHNFIGEIDDVKIYNGVALDF